MSALDESSAVTETSSTTTSSRSWTRAMRDPDLTTLSPMAHAIQITLVRDMNKGLDERDLAKKYKRSSSWVSEQLEKLRSEVALQDGFLPLSDEEYEQLKQSIETYGVRAPVVISVSESGRFKLIDGKHRWTASLELGREEIPAVFEEGLTSDQEHELSVMLNVARRHLNQEQKRTIVRSELMRDSSRSDRWIGKICGVHGTTVAAVREQLKKDGATLDAPSREEDIKATSEYEDPKAIQKPLLPRSSTTTPKASDDAGPVIKDRPFDWEKDAPEVDRRVDQRGHIHTVEPKPPKMKLVPPDERGTPEIGKREFVGYATCEAGCGPGTSLTIYWSGTYYTLVEERDT